MNTTPAVILPSAGIDVGFFSTKYTWGRTKDGRQVCTALFPSELADPMHVRDAPRDSGYRVVIDGAEYGSKGLIEFFGGAGVMNYLKASGARAYRPGYAREPSHKGLLRVALASIAARVRASNLKCRQLVVGAPVATFFQDRDFLQEACGGVHEIPGGSHDGSDLRVEVMSCSVIPQPAGTLFYLAYGAMPQLRRETTAVVDVGGGTADWALYHKMMQQSARCGTAEIGTLKFARQVCEKIQEGCADQPAVLAQVDAALQSGAPIVKLFGMVHELSPYLASIHQLQQEAVTAMLKSIEATGDLDNVVLTGGGASTFGPLLQAKLEQQNWRGQIFVDSDSVTANVKGFHIVGELADQKHSRQE